MRCAVCLMFGTLLSSSQACPLECTCDECAYSTLQNKLMFAADTVRFSARRVALDHAVCCGLVIDSREPSRCVQEEEEGLCRSEYARISAELDAATEERRRYDAKMRVVVEKRRINAEVQKKVDKYAHSKGDDDIRIYNLRKRIADADLKFKVEDGGQVV